MVWAISRDLDGVPKRYKDEPQRSNQVSFTGSDSPSPIWNQRTDASWVNHEDTESDRLPVLDVLGMRFRQDGHGGERETLVYGEWEPHVLQARAEVDQGLPHRLLVHAFSMAWWTNIFSPTASYK